MELRSITKDREHVFAENLSFIGTATRFARGRLVSREPKYGGVWRDNFIVKIDERNRFKVDIGTGSGVKVEFQLPKKESR